LKTKIIGILVITLFIATASPAVGTMNENKIPTIFGSSGNYLNKPNIPRIMNSVNLGSLFIQLPNDPEDPDASAWTSDLNPPDGSKWVYDDFWDVTSSICDVMTFNITFYEDNNGEPGTLVCSYDDVTYKIVKTRIMCGFFWGGFLHELIYYEAQLDPCCDISGGWMSIQGTSSPSGSWFLWMNSADGNNNAWQYRPPLSQLYDDLAFILTDGNLDIPDLECEGDLHWTDVGPGSKVVGNFKVRNNGNPDSILHWKIDLSTKPEWGSGWKFTPNASVLTTGMGWLTIDVEFKAPPEKNKKFTHKLKVINSADPSDYCEIDIVCTTPRSKGIYYPLLLRFFERFPNAFSILRQLFGLN